MNKQENKRSVIVGVFVLIGILILMAGIFIMGGQQNRFVSKVNVITVFDNVAGLKNGNSVWFSGVKVGIVKNVRFREDRKVEIVLGIDQRSREYIRKDAVAKLGSDGLIGNKIIVIEGGSSDVEPVDEGDMLQVVKTTDSDAMLETLQLNNENLVGITANLKVLTDRLAKGEGAAGAVLNDSLMGVHIKEMIAGLRQTAVNANRITASLADVTGKLNEKGTLVNDLLTDTAVYASLRSSVAQLQGITQTASALTSNLGEATEKLNRNDNAVGVLLNDPRMAETIRQTMVNLEQSTEKLDQNMEALQHNFLFRGFFRKQAREAEKAKKEQQQP